jgi:peptidyl-prolyl cis-trans isomerase B (cyclophilin B)
LIRKGTIVALLLALAVLLSFACGGGPGRRGEAGAESRAIATEYKIRNANNRIVTLETDYGQLVLELYRDVAPAHADSFAARVQDGFYDGVTFHRIVDGFMIQGGDPTGTGAGDAGYFLKAEFSSLRHVEGTLSMARAEDANSASCQFFICLDRNRDTAALDRKYTIFGQLIQGYAVLHRIGRARVTMGAGGEMSKPVNPIHIRKAFLSNAAGKPLATE